MPSRLISLIAVLLLFAADLPAARGGEWISAVGTGCRLWNPGPRAGESVRWHGRCERGMAQGRGVAEWFIQPALPDRCDCVFIDGKAQGRGTYRWADGVVYVGEFKAGIIEGNGYITYPDNETYEGEFKRGLPNGWGVQTLPDNTRIMGKFKDGARVETD